MILKAALVLMACIAAFGAFSLMQSKAPTSLPPEKILLAEQTAEEETEQGDKLLENNDFAGAKAHYERAYEAQRPFADRTGITLRTLSKAVYCAHALHLLNAGPAPNPQLLETQLGTQNWDALTMMQALLAKLYADNGRSQSAWSMADQAILNGRASVYSDGTSEPYWAKAQVALRAGKLEMMTSYADLAMAAGKPGALSLDRNSYEPVELGQIARKMYGENSEAYRASIELKNAYRRRFEHTEPMRAPTPVGPADGKIFPHYPRKTNLFWKPVEHAVSYTVEIQAGTKPELYKPWAHAGISETHYHFEFNGAESGRWRVRAVNAHGDAGPPCEWQHFAYSI